MSGRRKNAGVGYGMMFHGAFNEKKDAVKKERKTKGAFVRGVPTKHGYRYVVMSPRTNPPKRRKKAKVPKTPVITPNPTELLVMGANPSGRHKQEITVPAGTEIIIRTNPTHSAQQASDDARYMVQAAAELFPGRTLGSLSARELSAVAMRAAELKLGSTRHNVYFGFGQSSPTKQELTKSRQEFKARVRQQAKAMREEYRRMHRSARRSFKDKHKLETLFHEVYGQNPARNPSAEALRESFTGSPATHTSVMHEPHMPAGDYAMLGKLLSLYVKPRTGGQVLEIKAVGGTIVVADESARQIYFVGGDQDISSGLSIFGALDRGSGIYELGEARRIDYRQRKEHVPHPEADSWRHEFGEETGVRPLALYDANHKRILLEGGEYVIREEGIVN